MKKHFSIAPCPFRKPGWVPVFMAGTFVMFARHGRALTGASPEHAQIVGSV